MLVEVVEEFHFQALGPEGPELRSSRKMKRKFEAAGEGGEMEEEEAEVAWQFHPQMLLVLDELTNPGSSTKNML